jgi:hypothetical protein
MHPGKQPYTPWAEIIALAMVEEVVDEEEHKDTDARSRNAHTEKLTITPPKRAESESELQVIETSPGMKSGHSTTLVSQHTSWPTASTSNEPWINAAKSINAHHLHCL